MSYKVEVAYVMDCPDVEPSVGVYITSDEEIDAQGMREAVQEELDEYGGEVVNVIRVEDDGGDDKFYVGISFPDAVVANEWPDINYRQAEDDD